MNAVTIMFFLGLGVLLFGKNLPDVARKVGLGLMELRRGMSEIKGSLDIGSLETPHLEPQNRSEEFLESSLESQESLGTKFEPPSES